MVAITNSRYADSWTRSLALELAPDDVARLTQSQRIVRVRALMQESQAIYEAGIQALVTEGGYENVGIGVLFSGGNDSTVLAHLMRGTATFAAHANTGIGIEQTREFVRRVCAGWNLPLMERHAPEGSTYEDLVIDQGFPGPAHHWKMYQRLKERALMQIRRELVTRPRKQRVVYLAGRRQEESERRSDIPLYERQGSIVWISPMVFWHKMDLMTYRLMQPVTDLVPVNDVSQKIHMSGECLCGSFAKKDEAQEVGFFFPEFVAEIERLEGLVLASGKHPEWMCRWGWGADKDAIKKALKSGLSPEEVAALFTRSTTGPLCTDCGSREHGGEVVVV